MCTSSKIKYIFLLMQMFMNLLPRNYVIYFLLFHRASQFKNSLSSPKLKRRTYKYLYVILSDFETNNSNKLFIALNFPHNFSKKIITYRNTVA